jgi:hypothetical protein
MVAHATLLDPEAKKIVDQLVPVSQRGKAKMLCLLNDTCLPEDDCYGTEQEYEKVGIIYNSARADGRLRYVSVEFKRNTH